MMLANAMIGISNSCLLDWFATLLLSTGLIVCSRTSEDELEDMSEDIIAGRQLLDDLRRRRNGHRVASGCAHTLAAQVLISTAGTLVMSGTTEPNP